ncbi:hypothetical protein HYDPIDRAFT_28932 [Hydnomerulius pinastri MD-312]|uniref:Uncharacterized protein n=1 Tax=Hydnomerulius pinastri MD-312 TaxID=994086 RepID=A0A0C9VZZ0_9AGAM|nr:hypothetical protein HYDPIDRAFT_28932 [Hydnomerulius pinastri MD-312]
MIPFTRIRYSPTHKYTEEYPPGWVQGDPRLPVVYQEPLPLLNPGPVPQPRIPLAAENQNLRSGPAGVVNEAPPHVQRGGVQKEAADTLMEGGQPESWSYPLKKYLSTVWMPQYTLGSRTNTRWKWPCHRELQVPPGTRKLQVIRQINDGAFEKAVLGWIRSVPDFYVTSANAEKLNELALPDVDVKSLDGEDVRFLERFSMNFVTDVTRLLDAYAFPTATKALKLFAGIPEGHVLNEAIHLKDINQICPVQNATFDLAALPCPQGNDLTMLVVVVPPWDFQWDDLSDFVRPGQPSESLDDIRAASPHTVLWAVIWDICSQRNCRFFVLTSYDYWVFGNFSNDMRTAQVTQYMKAPVFPKEQKVGIHDVTDRNLPAPNVIESMMFWLAASMDPLRKEFKLPSDIH